MPANKPKRAKPVTAWCIVSDDGRLCPQSVSPSKAGVLQNLARYLGLTSTVLRADERIARVEIREVGQ